VSDEKRLETLSEEIKLLKGEIKNSLTSVRDYLLNMELPSSEFSTILAALSGDNSGQKVNLDGGLGKEPQPKMDELPEEPVQPANDLEQPPPDENLLDMEQPEDMMEDIPEGEPLSQEEGNEEGLIDDSDPGQPQADELMEESEQLEDPEDELDKGEESGEEDEEGLEDAEDEAESLEEEEDEDGTEEPEDENTDLPEDLEENEDSGTDYDIPAGEEQPMELERTTADVSQGTPRVNMLANLINWVSKAKKDIGDDLLPTFLDVYGVSGHLSLELKEVILHLAERTKEKTEPCTDAEVWSQAMLSLHGILTGGDAPLNPPIPAWREALEEDQDEEIIEVDKQQDKPIKLKFVLPSVNGKEKEYCLDLTPQDDSDE
jgi:hypothetical protein